MLVNRTLPTVVRVALYDTSLGSMASASFACCRIEISFFNANAVAPIAARLGTADITQGPTSSSC